eukprot:TRINITY_DN33833_c0_g1_i4.p1 TRINITY_DN33833_c0_g1~~TRINITY_DN33833_c0_g1_i4.p1  ORF type:complete len:141 (-),score=23.79 TRINITY_DN33833_c0_g1_i4:10-432(-)
MSETEKDGEKEKVELERRKAKRKLVVEELLSTEKTYVSSLDVLYRHFYLPLAPKDRRAQSRGSTVSESPISEKRTNKGTLRLPIPPDLLAQSPPAQDEISSPSSSILASQDHQFLFDFLPKIGRAVQQECRDRSRMPSSA